MFNTIDDLVRYIRRELIVWMPKKGFYVVSKPLPLGNPLTESTDVHEIVIQTADFELVQLVDMNSVRLMISPEAYGRYFVLGVLKRFGERGE